MASFLRRFFYGLISLISYTNAKGISMGAGIRFGAPPGPGRNRGRPSLGAAISGKGLR
jgi:hypothetical protein